MTKTTTRAVAQAIVRGVLATYSGDDAIGERLTVLVSELEEMAMATDPDGLAERGNAEASDLLDDLATEVEVAAERLWSKADPVAVAIATNPDGWAFV